MSANPPGTEFTTLASGDVAWIQVAGPGVCRESGGFEGLLREVEKLAFGNLVIELSLCPRMDSTFAGALLRLAERASAARQAGRPLRVVLSGVRGQVEELIETLYLTDAFEFADLPTPSGAEAVTFDAADLTKEEIMALSLDGHDRIVRWNPANAPKFAGVLAVLREQLKRLRAEAPSAPPGQASRSPMLPEDGPGDDGA